MEKAKRRFLIILIVFFLHPLILGPLLWPIIRDFQSAEYQEAFSAWVASLGIWGVLILFGLQVLQIVVAMLPGGPTQIIAGAAYGVWGGIAILQVGCAFATVLIFLLVRRFGAPLVVRLFGSSMVETWGFLSSEKKTSQVAFILFLIPGTPKDLLTYVAALTRLSLPQFLVISLVARFPAMFSSAVMGDAFVQGNWITLFLVFFITGLAGILGIQFKDRMIARFSSRPVPGKPENSAS